MKSFIKLYSSIFDTFNYLNHVREQVTDKADHTVKRHVLVFLSRKPELCDWMDLNLRFFYVFTVLGGRRFGLHSRSPTKYLQTRFI